MPQYVFLCQDCHKEFTKSLHMADLTAPNVQCPQCGSTNVQQQAAAFAAMTSKKS
jgi:putative FmdB family regulatory protein